MKILLSITTSLVLMVVVALFTLGLMSQSGQAGGLVQGKLTKCPDSPNCNCSEYPEDVDHFIEPMIYSEQDGVAVLTRLKALVRQMGGSVQVENTDYLAATFTSSIFGFVDDLEIRIDSGQKKIHLRSASRVGRGDGGVNRERLERLSRLFHLNTG